MEVYITKYAISRGFIKIKIKDEDWIKHGEYIYVSLSEKNIFEVLMLKNFEIFSSKEEAIENFERRIDKKIESLKNSIIKLEKRKKQINI